MDILDDTKKKMQAVIEHLKEDLKGIRTGHANPAILDPILVDVYGTKMRIRELAGVASPEPRQIIITPYDPKNTPHIGKAIEKANLGFMPIVEGNLVRINIPPMDESMRKEMVKLCSKRKEDAKVRVRDVRRDSNEILKKQKSEHASEDEIKRQEKHVQELTDKFCKEADELAVKKEKEIMTV